MPFVCRHPGSSGQTRVWTGAETGGARAACSIVPRIPSFIEQTASAVRWETFWKSGEAIDLPAATTLERVEHRIVLFAILMAANDVVTGSWPSSENGLVGIDLARRFHMEMVWWHGPRPLGCWEIWALGC